jgi:hypothetical protein
MFMSAAYPRTCREILEAASQEYDSEKLTKLIEELNEALCREDEQRARSLVTRQPQ